MKTAQNVMQAPPPDIQLDHPAKEAVIRFQELESELLLVVDGDRVKGVLHRDTLSPADPAQEDDLLTVGDLLSLTLAICELETPVALVGALFAQADPALVLVIDEERQVCGIITPEAVSAPARLTRTPQTIAMMGTAMPRDNREPYKLKPHVERHPPGSNPIGNAD